MKNGDEERKGKEKSIEKDAKAPSTMTEKFKGSKRFSFR